MNETGVRLSEAGTATRQAERAVATAHQTLRLAVRRAAKAGMSKTEIANRAGVSRTTVHTILKGNR